MANTIKCGNCNIVIDELLAYIQNKLSIADEISLVQICASAFSCEEIERSSTLLLESLPTEKRKTTRKGKGKENRLLYDIINIFKVTDADILPVFVARDLGKLPPITFDHLDVSKLLKDLMILQNEVSNIKSSYVTLEQMEDIKRECLKTRLPSPPISALKVNMKRGAYRDSGPSGLSQLDNSTTRILMDEAPSPKEFEVKDKNKYIENVNEGIFNFCSDNTSKITAERFNLNDPGDRRDYECIKGGSKDKTKVAKIQTYAGVLSTHNNTEDGWIKVHKKTRKPTNRFIGKTGNGVVNSEEKFRAADRKISLFVTNVHKDTKECDIIEYIESKTNEKVSLQKMSIKRQCEYDAYKVFVSQSKLQMYLNENLWPEGIIFRRFVHFRQKLLTETENPAPVVTRENLPNLNG